MITNVPLSTVRSGPTGKMFVNGISSSYDDKYHPELASVLSREEHSEILKRLNTTLATYWPCSTVYFCGCILVPCTMGLSLLCPMMCISEAEIHANRLLENLSLKAKHFDRNTSFRLEKGCFTSHFVITFPSFDGQLENVSEDARLLGGRCGDIESCGGNEQTTEPYYHRSNVLGIQEEPGRTLRKND